MMQRILFQGGPDHGKAGLLHAAGVVITLMTKRAVYKRTERMRGNSRIYEYIGEK